MASYIYAIATQKPGSMDQTGPEFTGETEVPGTWTSVTAAHWARTEGRKLAPGTKIIVWRWLDGPGRLPRQGHGMQHRAYVVQSNGIVRRTDR